MDYYNISCELDRISAKIECFAEMIGALAEAEVAQQASGTYWFIYDTAKQYVSEIETLSGKAMANHMANQEEKFKPKKGKKK